jgi:hypothetical protein
VLYGVGARLDEKPALLFAIWGVDENQLLANAGQELSLKKAVPARTRVLVDSDVATLFGLEMVERSDTPDSLAEARQIIEAWRLDYNHARPHSSLGTLTPSEFAELQGDRPPEQAQGSAARPLLHRSTRGKTMPFDAAAYAGIKTARF